MGLHNDQGGAPRKQDWNSCSVIGMLKFLCYSTGPDISYAVHQCARFSENHKSSHEKESCRLLNNSKGQNMMAYFSLLELVKNLNVMLTQTLLAVGTRLTVRIELLCFQGLAL